MRRALLQVLIREEWSGFNFPRFNKFIDFTIYRRSFQNYSGSQRQERPFLDQCGWYDQHTKNDILFYALGEHLSSCIGHQWTPFLCNIQLQSDYVDNRNSQWRK